MSLLKRTDSDSSLVDVDFLLDIVEEKDLENLIAGAIENRTDSVQNIQTEHLSARGMDGAGVAAPISNQVDFVGMQSVATDRGERYPEILVANNIAGSAEPIREPTVAAVEMPASIPHVVVPQLCENSSVVLALPEKPKDLPSVIRAKLRVLGMNPESESVTIENINRRYREMARELHPQSGGNREVSAPVARFQELRLAEVTAAKEDVVEWYFSELAQLTEDQLNECFHWADEILLDRDTCFVLDYPAELEDEKWRDQVVTVQYQSASGQIVRIMWPIRYWQFYCPRILELWSERNGGKSTRDCANSTDSVVDLGDRLAKNAFWFFYMDLINCYSFPR